MLIYLQPTREVDDPHLRTYFFFETKNYADEIIKRFSNNSEYEFDSFCETSLESFRKSFYDNMIEEFNDNEEIKENSQCLIEVLQSVNITDLAIKRYLIEKIQEIPTLMKVKAVRKLDHDIEKYIGIAEVICTAYQKFGEYFDFFYNDANYTYQPDDDNASLAKDICLRQYIVDNEFINTTIFNVTVNPYNIDVSELSCEEVIEKEAMACETGLKQEYSTALVRSLDDEVNCIGKAIRFHHFFENSIIVSILGEIQLSDTLKAEQKEIFIDRMSLMNDDIMKC